jgi:pyruvate dehydrogenase E2 component (dihydrolipoamide acetyltransferase)
MTQHDELLMVRNGLVAPAYPAGTPRSAASMASPRCRFSRAMNQSRSGWDRHTRPLTAPCRRAQHMGDLAAGPGEQLARELGLDLSALSGTGPKGRITKEDVIAGVRGPAAPPADAGAAVAAGGGIPEVPAQDFSKFGPVEVKPLTRIQRLSGPALHRSWLNVPHVTHDDEADITGLDAYRRELDAAAKAEATG